MAFVRVESVNGSTKMNRLMERDKAPDDTVLAVSDLPLLRIRKVCLVNVRRVYVFSCSVIH
jgi:hypothetical protein